MHVKMSKCQNVCKTLIFYSAISIFLFPPKRFLFHNRLSKKIVQKVSSQGVLKTARKVKFQVSLLRISHTRIYKSTTSITFQRYRTDRSLLFFERKLLSPASRMVMKNVKIPLPVELERSASLQVLRRSRKSLEGWFGRLARRSRKRKHRRGEGAALISGERGHVPVQAVELGGVQQAAEFWRRSC